MDPERDDRRIREESRRHHARGGDTIDSGHRIERRLRTAAECRRHRPDRRHRLPRDDLDVAVAEALTTLFVRATQVAMLLGCHPERGEGPA